MSTRTIFLMGAPTLSSLQWDESHLLHEPIPPFQGPDVRDESCSSAPETRSVKWRLLQGHAIPETPQVKGKSKLARAVEFLTTEDLAAPDGKPSIMPEDSELSQFYNHSFAVHETSEISAPGALSGDATLDSGLWTDSTATSIASNNEGEIAGVQLVHIQGGLTNLQDIPNTAYLHSIVPQTMTVNLIVAIIAVRPPRRIVTRQWRKDLDLVEVVVGDETRSGFGVTFWLPTDHEVATRPIDQGGKELRRSLALLRPRDIVLLRMVGLSYFRERVYGQSLRRGITKIELLHRQQVDATDTGGIYRLRDILPKHHEAKNLNEDLPLAKVRKVREWIRQFVDVVPDSAGGDALKGTVTLPPDTQEGEDGL